MNRIKQWSYSPDLRAVLFLIAIWFIFFWRLFTPTDADRVTLVDGDFSGQFVAFGAYQYERLSDGEIPLWNPYNNAGLPFIGDTQAAVFYPPRLATIGLSSLTDSGWTYNALQLEMTAHVLAYTFFMYLFVRRLSIGMKGSVFGALVSAIIVGYSGFTTGYPPLQLALLEAAIWSPLVLLGILEATRHDTFNWRWLLFSGFALGLSWMAGHPQTSWFITYLIIAYFAYRVYDKSYSWRQFIIGTAAIGVVTVGVVAVQLLPALEYTSQSMRTGLGFDEKGGGFPFQDIVQFVLPSVVSIYSPLFIGIVGLFLALIGIIGKTQNYLFWVAGAIIALLLSFGANSALFHTLYNILPGLSYFRGQERAAYLVMNNLAVLAGLGTVHLFMLNTEHNGLLIKRIRIGLSGLLAFFVLLGAVILVAWLGDSEKFGHVIQSTTFSAIIISVLVFLHYTFNNKHPYWKIAIILLLVFELFSVNLDNEANYEVRPAWDKNPLATPVLVQQIQADEGEFYRVDGNFFGLYGNYGSLFGVHDIRGISPLFIDGAHAIIQRELPDEVAWELFGVKYVLSGAETLPIGATQLGQEIYRGETIYLHQLTNPRPFAALLYDYTVLDSDEFARALLADPNFDERNTAILHTDPQITLPDNPSSDNQVELIEFEHEHFAVQITTEDNAILSLAHVDYPGWSATLDGESIDIIRAYGGLTALAIPAGDHTIHFEYNPLSYKVGAILSLFTWGGLIILGGVLIMVKRRKANATK